jgi:hypothetical protein
LKAVPEEPSQRHKTGCYLISTGLRTSPVSWLGGGAASSLPALALNNCALAVAARGSALQSRGGDGWLGSGLA